MAAQREAEFHLRGVHFSRSRKLHSAHKDWELRKLSFLAEGQGGGIRWPMQVAGDWPAKISLDARSGGCRPGIPAGVELSPNRLKVS